MERCAEQVCAAHGVPDVVVNNAGVGHGGRFLQTPAERYDRVLDGNFGGVVNCCRSFGRRLVERGTGGHIVNVASMAAYTPARAMNAYPTSKAAVFMFSDCLRAELAAAGIGLTTVCPGTIDNAFAARRYAPDKVAKAILAAVGKNQAIRLVTPQAHVAYAVSRLLPSALRRAARSGSIQRFC